MCTQAGVRQARAPPPPPVLLPADLRESQAGAQAPGVCSQRPYTVIAVFVGLGVTCLSSPSTGPTSSQTRPMPTIIVSRCTRLTRPPTAKPARCSSGRRLLPVQPWATGICCVAAQGHPECQVPCWGPWSEGTGRDGQGRADAWGRAPGGTIDHHDDCGRVQGAAPHLTCHTPPTQGYLLPGIPVYQMWCRGTQGVPGGDAPLQDE